MLPIRLPVLFINKEDPKRVVVITDLLRYFETKYVRQGGWLNREIRQCYCQCVVRDDVLVCTENRHQALVGVAVDQ